MDKDIKKKLTRNWFINLQEMICNTIQQIEGGKMKFLKKSWKVNGNQRILGIKRCVLDDFDAKSKENRVPRVKVNGKYRKLTIT